MNRKSSILKISMYPPFKRNLFSPTSLSKLCMRMRWVKIMWWSAKTFVVRWRRPSRSRESLVSCLIKWLFRLSIVVLGWCPVPPITALSYFALLAPLINEMNINPFQVFFLTPLSSYAPSVTREGEVTMLKIHASYSFFLSDFIWQFLDGKCHRKPKRPSRIQYNLFLDFIIKGTNSLYILL